MDLSLKVEELEFEAMHKLLVSGVYEIINQTFGESIKNTNIGLKIDEATFDIMAFNKSNSAYDKIVKVGYIKIIKKDASSISANVIIFLTLRKPKTEKEIGYVKVFFL